MIINNYDYYRDYHIYLIKYHPWINATQDQMPQMEAKLPINAAPNQRNVAFTRG